MPYIKHMAQRHPASKSPLSCGQGLYPEVDMLTCILLFNLRFFNMKTKWVYLYAAYLRLNTKALIAVCECVCALVNYLYDLVS